MPSIAQVFSFSGFVLLTNMPHRRVGRVESTDGQTMESLGGHCDTHRRSQEFDHGTPWFTFAPSLRVEKAELGFLKGKTPITHHLHPTF